MKKSIKYFIPTSFGFILIFFLFYLWFKGKSGGDIALSAFTVIFLVLYSIILGILTFKWLFKDKLGVILGLVFSYLLAFIFIRWLSLV